jgi:hypothetical protein
MTFCKHVNVRWNKIVAFQQKKEGSEAEGKGVLR